jgi:selenocysteine-specific elongation factor
VKAFHDAHPLAPGMPVHELGGQLRIDGALLNELLDGWSLHRTGAAVTLPDRDSALPPDQRAKADAAIDKLRAGGASPPSLAAAGLSVDLAKALERAGELVLVNADIGYPSDVWNDMRGRIVQLIAARGPATVAQIREALGTSRKYAVPLLERLDADGITQRAGDVRSLGPRGRALASTKEDT